MALIELTNPLGGTVHVETDDVLIVFFSPFLSPPNAKSNVIYAGSIRSFFDSPEEVAAKIIKHRKLVQFTLPDTNMPNRAKGPIWFARSAIDKVIGNGKKGARIDMKGQQGLTEVVETEEEVLAAIAAVDQLPA
jgi:hypothetical protein